MRNSFLKIILIIILPLCSCTDKQAAKVTETNTDISNFKYREIKIRTSYTLGVAGCLNWYTDFSNVKKSVIYKDRIISVGLFGGFCSFDKNSFKVDSSFTRKLNSDLFTNVTVVEDTLYAELFDKIYYLNDKSKWVEYKTPKPIKYFDTLLDDKDYVFYYSTSGEWGSILFAYNKKTELTHGLVTGCPTSVTKVNNEYLINTATRHMGTWTDVFRITDPDRLKVISDTLRLNSYVWERLGKQINDTSDKVSQYIKPVLNFTENWDTAIVSTFAMNNRIYSFIRADRRPYIGKLVKDKYILLDTVSNKIDPATIVSYSDNERIVNEAWSGGLSLIRNDTICKITFENSYIPQKTTVTQSKNYTFNLYKGNNRTARKGQAEREIEFDFKNEYKVIGLYGNGMGGNYILHNNKKSRLKIQSGWNFIDYIYVANGNLFLNFMNLGNIDHKYNLIEITDIDKFIDRYSVN